MQSNRDTTQCKDEGKSRGSKTDVTMSVAGSNDSFTPAQRDNEQQPDYRFGPSNTQHKSHKTSDNRENDPSPAQTSLQSKGDDTRFTDEQMTTVLRADTDWLICGLHDPSEAIQTVNEDQLFNNSGSGIAQIRSPKTLQKRENEPSPIQTFMQSNRDNNTFNAAMSDGGLHEPSEFVQTTHEEQVKLTKKVCIRENDPSPGQIFLQSNGDDNRFADEQEARESRADAARSAGDLYRLSEPSQTVSQKQPFNSSGSKLTKEFGIRENEPSPAQKLIQSNSDDSIFNAAMSIGGLNKPYERVPMSEDQVKVTKEFGIRENEASPAHKLSQSNRDDNIFNAAISDDGLNDPSESTQTTSEEQVKVTKEFGIRENDPSTGQKCLQINGDNNRFANEKEARGSRADVAMSAGDLNDPSEPTQTTNEEQSFYSFGSSIAQDKSHKTSDNRDNNSSSGHKFLQINVDDNRFSNKQKTQGARADATRSFGSLNYSLEPAQTASKQHFFYGSGSSITQVESSRTLDSREIDTLPIPAFAHNNRIGTRLCKQCQDDACTCPKEVAAAESSQRNDEKYGLHRVRLNETSNNMQTSPVGESAQSSLEKRPKFPNYVSLPSRIATFADGWPSSLKQTPQEMAEAGFFYIGVQDHVRCFRCGGGLRNWEPQDNPWIEHCRWYPTCSHVLQCKGQRFINAVLKKQAELLTSHQEKCRTVHQGSGNFKTSEKLAVITLQGMGYSLELIHKAIQSIRRQRGDDVRVTAETILDFIWSEEDKERQQQRAEASRHHNYRFDANRAAASEIFQPIRGYELQRRSSGTEFPRYYRPLMNNQRQVGNEAQNIPVHASLEQLVRYMTESARRGGVANEAPQINLQRHGVEVWNNAVDLSPYQANPSGTLERPNNGAGQLIAYLDLENENLRRPCIICYTRHSCIVLRPCGHLVTCSECASYITQSCPICRSNVQDKINANFR